MKLCVCAYIPPPHFGNGQVFLDNIRKFKTRYDLVLLSDHEPYGLTAFPNPEIAMTAGDGIENPIAVNNFIFLLCYNHVGPLGYSHMLYVEADSRVGCDYWDEKMFDEFFANPGPIVAGGSLVCYSPCAGGREGLKRFSELVARENARKNFPVAAYQPKAPQFPMVKVFGGNKGAADSSGSALFPNGSLSIYSLEWLRCLLPRGDILQSACTMTAWDLAIGKLAWEQYGPNVYDIMAHLKTTYSSYGDALTTEAERLQMLKNGVVFSVHQVKSKLTV